MQPNKNNFCGGNFQDWLEVNLTDKCNGKCSWCIEKNGYHPTEHAEWRVIVEQALKSDKTNIILLGGEPTLCKDISKIICALNSACRKVWVTTNGGLLSPNYIINELNGITGINISIHDSDLEKNRKITGVFINDLKGIIAALHEIGANVRLNCNCILGHVDNVKTIERYIAFAKSVGADKIRLAELKQDEERFIDLAKVLNYKYGLNDDPFTNGCHSDAIINGMSVNFRQMCGLQTPRRPEPKEPEQYAKQVLYYDGEFYDGWQTTQYTKKEKEMTDKELMKILQDVADGKITAEEAANKIRKGQKKQTTKSSTSSGGCQY